MESLWGGGDCLLGGASAEPRDPGLVRRAGRASTFTRDWGHRQDACATLRAVMAHSSPEPAALSFGGGLGSEETIAGWVARVRSLAIPGVFGERLVRRGRVWRAGRVGRG